MGVTALLDALTWQERVFEMSDIMRDVLGYLKKQPKTQDRDDLIERVAIRLPTSEKQRPCKINFAIPSNIPKVGDMDRRYPFFKKFLIDGYVCSGCGGYNDRGHGGYCGDMCWHCWEIEQEHETEAS